MPTDRIVVSTNESGPRTGAIDLAHRRNIRLSPLIIDPSSRSLRHDDGREAILEPRMMQVLVTLAEANGQTLSRDDLIARCWDGRVVGDEAISSVIYRLRKTLNDLTGESLCIETIPKVGFRLLNTPAGADHRRSHDLGKSPSRPGTRRRMVLAIASLTFTAVAGATGYFIFAGANRDTTTISIAGETPGRIDSDLARSIAAEMGPALAARAKDAMILDPAAGNADKADLRLQVATNRNETGAEGTLSLISRREGGIIWSRKWNSADLSAADVRQQMSLVAPLAVLCAVEGDKGGLSNREGALGFYVEACTRDYNADRDSLGELVNLLTKTVERAPDFAPAWGQLAVIYSDQIGYFRRSDQEAESAELVQKSQNAIEKARKADPSSAMALLAEGLAQSRATYALPFIDRAASADPYDPTIRNVRGWTLMSVGRQADAVVDARKAVELAPWSAVLRSALVSILMRSGRQNEALVELEKAEKLWPNNPDMKISRFNYELEYGDPRIAQKLLRSLPMLDDEQIELLQALIRARIDPRPANVDSILAELRNRREKRPGSYLRALRLFGRVDETYQLLNEPKFQRRFTTPIGLFVPQSGPVRADPRFMKIAADIGLVSYWRSSGKWPDFCSDPNLPYDCKVEAAKYK